MFEIVEQNSITARIKVISKLDISEKRVPQDGRMKLALSGSRAIDFRVSTLPTLYGEKIVMRILDPSQAKLGIDALGYDPDQKQLLLDVPLTFLDAGKSYVAEIYADGPGADWLTNPLPVTISRRTVTRNSRLRIALAPGGGQAIRIRPAPGRNQ